MLTSTFIVMPCISSLKSSQTLPLQILTLAFAVCKAKSPSLLFNSGHTIFRFSLMTLKTIQSSREKSESTTMPWHLPLWEWTLTWLFKVQGLYLFIFMALSIISWVLSCHQMTSSPLMLDLNSSLLDLPVACIFAIISHLAPHQSPHVSACLLLQPNHLFSIT